MRAGAATPPENDTIPARRYPAHMHHHYPTIGLAIAPVVIGLGGLVALWLGLSA